MDTTEMVKRQIARADAVSDLIGSTPEPERGIIELAAGSFLRGFLEGQQQEREKALQTTNNHTV